MNAFEANGAVFLPAAGDRWGTSVVEFGTGGFYWSATQRYDSQAYDISFRVDEMCCYGYCGYYRNCGRSVRLVHTAGNFTSYGVEATPNPAEGGTVTGAGIYQEGDICTLSATPNQGYAFTNWTENGEVVSTDASYTFTVTGVQPRIFRLLQANQYRSYRYQQEDGFLDPRLYLAQQLPQKY